jgi:hypothetical protein
MKRGSMACLLFASVVIVSLPGHDALGEEMTCIGSCRMDYGACIMNSKGDTPADQERKAECGRAYVKCASKCRAGGT